MNEKLLAAIGKRLKEERERLGLNKSQIASLAGCVISTYTNYEDGLREPTATFLINLSTNANVNLLYVLTGLTSENVATTNEEASLLQCYRLLDTRPRLAVNRMLTTLSGILEPEVSSTNIPEVNEKPEIEYQSHLDWSKNRELPMAAEPKPKKPSM